MNDINEITVVLGVVGVTIVLFIWNRLPVEVVAVGATLAARRWGDRPPPGARGFGDPTVVFIATLFVVPRRSTLGDRLGGPAPRVADG